MRKTIGLLAAAGLVSALAIASGALAGDNDSGFTTSRPSMIAPPTTALPGQAPQPNAIAGVTVKPIVTVGDTLPGGYRFESIPDGIALRERGQGRVDLYVNHETSLVPFPYSLTAPTTTPELRENNQNDFDNSQVSLLAMNQHSGGLLSGRYVVSSDENYQRFCSNYLATEAEGFDRPLLFTNEEAQDWVRRDGVAWDGTGTLPGGFFAPRAPGTEQAGVVVAHDVQSGKTKPIYGMGRHNHENTVAIPGYADVVLLSGDDTFNTTPRTLNGKTTYAWSQLYMYVAGSSDEVWNDEGTLYAFVSNGPKDGYYDVAPGSSAISGRFVEVPKRVATGKDPVTGAELLSTDFPGMDAPPSGTPDGPQWVLDQWGEAANNEHAENVFRFVRVEDIAYDKRPGMEKVVYIADSGRGRRSQDTPANDTPFRSTNGRIWKMVLNEDNPLVVDSLEVLVEGDDNPVSGSAAPANAAELAYGEIRQPDNLETTASGSLMVQEDPGSSQQFSASSTAVHRTAARIWRVDLKAATPDAAKAVAAVVDQSADEGPTDVDGAGANAPPAVVRGSLGAWESSGIVDASGVFGPGAFFVTVQAGTLWIEKRDGPDTAGVPASPDYVFKRSGGQLVLLRIPGA